MWFVCQVQVDTPVQQPLHFFNHDRLIWLTIALNITYAVALSGLMLFYRGTHELLQPYKPLLKFVLIKAVVFLTFWQVCCGMHGKNACDVVCVLFGNVCQPVPLHSMVLPLMHCCPSLVT